LGASAGVFRTTGSNNIDIGALGAGGESNTIRLGKAGVQTATYIIGIRGATVAGGVGVIVDTNGHLGTMSSSARFKKEIKPMDQTSEAILDLKPVTFHYKRDAKSRPQFGLIAEDVAKVNPDLVARDAKGEIYTVRYEAVNAMLLNEFLKEHKTVQEQGATIAEFKKEIANLTATVKEQASQIQKVSAQLEVNKTAPQVVLNNQ
jgi:predicted ribosome quality control (RQC) complex YloA/Tae2 family protein